VSDRTARHVIEDVLDDLAVWGLTVLQEVHYLTRISAYHKRLFDCAQRAERTPADRVRTAAHFGRWFGVTSYLLWLTKPLMEYRPPAGGIHRAERPGPGS
jgi:hypothetical protein